MKAKHKVWKSKLAKTMFLMTVVLVAAMFVGTAAATGLQPNRTVTQKNSNTQSLTNTKGTQLRADGLAPQTQTTPQQGATLGDRGYFYAYKASPSPYGTITFDDPGTIEILSTTGPSFIAGGDIDDLGNWYGVAYYGGIYTLGFDGTITLGPSSIAMNGLVFDYANGLWYGCDATNLYIVDILTGATTIVGPLGAPNTIIGLACDKDGNMYGYDVLFSGMSSLYSIDTSTGHATVIGSMGVGFLYAQDPEYDRDMGILYIAGYTQAGTSGLYTCDVDTGAVTLIGAFEGNYEVDALSIPWQPIPFEHDIAITSITAPSSQNAAPITPIVKVKNSGENTEFNVPIELTIGHEQVTGSVEDFEANNGSYTHAPKLPQPDAWQWGAPAYASGPATAYSGSNCWGTNLAGAYPPSMWCYLETPAFTVPVGTMLNFWTWYYFESNYDGGNVKISNDGGVTWTLITPVGGYPGSMPYNPFMTGQAAFNGQSGGWKQVFFDLSAYEGQEVQLMFETASDSSVQYAGWYIDNVGFTITSFVNEYDQIVTIPQIDPDQVINVTFPTWTPADLGLVENTNINYGAEATNLLVDNNSVNDVKDKDFTLHYGYFDDVAITQIVSPVSGLAETQIPEVTIANNGQNDESVNVNMEIGKAVYTTILEEDFSGGVPPAGWGTNYPSNWLSSSTNYAGGTAPEAEFYYSPSSVGEHILYTMPLDTTGYTALLLRFKEYVNDYNGDYTLKIVTSIDGGATWNTAYSRAGGPYGPATTEITLGTADGVGSDQLMIGWDMSGDSFNINYWYIDDVFLGQIDLVEEYSQTVTADVSAGQTIEVTLPAWTPSDVPMAMSIDYLVTATATLNGLTAIYGTSFEDWVPPVPPVPPTFPPSGWAVYDVNGGSTWRYSSSGALTGTGCAYDSYDYPAPNNDWIATKGTVVAPGGVFSFWLKGYTYSDDTFEVYMSTTGNTVADFTTMLYSGTAASTYTFYSFDMSAYVGMTVYFAIRYTGDNAWYIWLDDVAFPDGTTQGFEGTPGQAGYWPGYSQFVISGDSTLNYFDGVQTGSYPTTVPEDGSWMAQYQAFSIPSGNSVLMTKDDPFDFTGASGYALKFWMMHDLGYTTSADRITVCYSTDGTDFYFIQTFNRYDGTVGWAQHTVDLTFLAGLPEVWIGLYAESFYGDNVFIDNMQLFQFGSLADGHPSDNTLSEIITLSYEHDVGVVAITQPSQMKRDDVIFHQGYYGPDEAWAFETSGAALGYVCYDDFYGLADTIGSVSWFGLSLGNNGAWYETSPDMLFDITFYEDNAGAPGAVVQTFTGLHPAYVDTGLDFIGYSMYQWTIELPESLTLTSGWMSIQSEVPADSGNLLWASGPDGNNNALQGTTQLLTNLAFDLIKAITPTTPFPPGTYPVQAIVQNLGVTYPESDIPVNAKITHVDNSTVIYDENMTVPGPLAPGETAVVDFPEFTLYNLSAWEGQYKIEVKTMLPGDDHANNDKKTLTITMNIVDVIPPITNYTLSGTMGNAGWYVSNVIITLSAYDPLPPKARNLGLNDPKPPSGVHATYYSFDGVTFDEYTGPITVDQNGIYTLYYYSDDNAGNVEAVHGPVNFKIDKTGPTFNDFNATKQGFNKWLLTADVSDSFSGVAKVEFYVNSALVGTVEAPGPYTFEVSGKGTAQAIAYDVAGNSMMSEVKTSYEPGIYTQGQTVQVLPNAQLLLQH